MEKPVLADQSIEIMKCLMLDQTIKSKVMGAGEEGKSYAITTIRSDGKVILGETKYRFWNQLIGCKFTLTFEAWASCVWDALLDLSTGLNQKALLHGLSKEILEKAQREKKYDWIVKRLYDCYDHICNNKGDATDLEGSAGKSGLSGQPVVVGGEGVIINVNNKPFSVPISHNISESIDVDVNIDGTCTVRRRR